MEEFSQRKFRAYRTDDHFYLECDECGRTIPAGVWYFERIEKGHYGGENPLGPGRIKHVEEITRLCRDCVDRSEIAKESQKRYDEGGERA